MTPHPAHAIRRPLTCGRTIRRVGCALLLAVAALAGHAQPAPAAASCPPVVQMPDAAQLQAAQRQARDRGMLWRISRDGRSSHLYASLHLGRLAWAFPGPKLRAALDASAVLALELDLMDPAILRELQAGLAQGAGAPELPPALLQRLERQREAACLPNEALAGLHPTMRAITLLMLAGRWDELDAAYGQEFVLGGFARARGWPVVSLETPQEQMQALVPADDAQALHQVEQAMAQLEQGVARPQMRRLAAAWEAGRLDELERYADWCDCANDEADRAALARLLDGRNPALAERIAELHAAGKPVFAAVGALHMVGAQGLPRLLAARGFKVERIVFAPM
jgi:uncharacterized protein